MYSYIDSFIYLNLIQLFFINCNSFIHYFLVHLLIHLFSLQSVNVSSIHVFNNPNCLKAEGAEQIYQTPSTSFTLTCKHNRFEHHLSPWVGPKCPRVHAEKLAYLIHHLFNHKFINFNSFFSVRILNLSTFGTSHCRAPLSSRNTIFSV